MTKIVVYRPEACNPPRGKNAALNLDDYPWRLRLSPGNNQVSDEDAAKLEEHPSFAKYEASEALTIKDTPEESSPSDSTAAPENLSQLNVDEAGDLIDQTDNVDLLNKWLAAERRVTTRADLERRIKALTEAE